MNRKEHKGGVLTNKQLEEELERNNTNGAAGGYHGSQDTGDKIVREKGTEVQQEDGAGNNPNPDASKPNG